MSEQPIDTMNDQLVGMQGKCFRILAPKAVMTPDEALRLAAWLVSMAQPFATHTFEDVLTAIANA